MSDTPRMARLAGDELEAMHCLLNEWEDSSNEAAMWKMKALGTWPIEVK